MTVDSYGTTLWLRANEGARTADTHPEMFGGHVPEDPTIGELGRSIHRLEEQFNSMDSKWDKRFSELATAIEQRPSSERVSQLERDLERATTAIGELTRALDAERQNRASEITAEREARLKDLEREKARIGVWFRWLFGSVAVAVGAAVANAFGLHVG